MTVRLLLTILSCLLLVVACSSSEPEKTGKATSSYPGLIALTQPDSEKTTSSTVYADSAEWVQQDSTKALLIKGNLANGCTYLRGASHTFKKDSLAITLDAWQPADRMCTQALVPFSFIYNAVSPDQLPADDAIQVNGRRVKMEPDE